MADPPHIGTTKGRFRVYGGSVAKHSLLPLAAHDFQRRSHVLHSGWPSDPAEPSPYLHQCEQSGVNHAPYSAIAGAAAPAPACPQQ